jgi:hypothetical protein
VTTRDTTKQMGDAGEMHRKLAADAVVKLARK